MRDTPAMARRPLRALLVGLVAAAVAGTLAQAPAVERLELATLDQRFEWRGRRPPPRDVAIVGINEGTFRALRLRWPFPRALHARAIRRLLAAGARRVVYDVQFSEPSDDPRGDAALLAAAADPRVVLGTAQLSPDGAPAVLGGAARLRARGGAVGLAYFPTDPDGRWRRVTPRIDGHPQLSALAAGRLDGPSALIDFAGPPDTIPERSFAALVQGRLDPAAVRGRIVVVGATAPALQDFHPAATGALMSGAELHANAIQTLLDGRPLRALSPLLGALLVLAAGLVAPLAALPGGPTRALVQALAAGALGAVALLAGAQLAFDGGTVVPVAAPLLALALGTAGAVALTYAVELRARRRVRHAFERFVPPAVVREILARDGGGRVALPPRRLEATVLFCDLRGFTTLAERLAAEQVIAALNRYLQLVSDAVFAHGGTVVSYQGDGVLAVFGAPLPRDDHAAAALAAARAILAELPTLNRWLRDEGLAERPLEVGIGVNSGPVMSGSVGSARRVEYAAVGDATNVAARLQALGRELPGRLFVADATVAAAGAAATAGLRRHGEVALKGRREPVYVWVEA